MTRSVTSATGLREQGIETVVADLASEAWHDQIEGGSDLVLNCVSSGGSELDKYQRSYLEGMASILAWARRKGGIGTMVYTSSTSVYPQGGGATIDESAETGGTDRAAILLGAEALLRAATKECTRWFILRLAGLYGPGRHHFIDQIRAGEVSGRGEHRLNLVHRDDAVAAIWACFLAPRAVRNEVFNVTDDGAAPKQEIAAWVAGELKVPAARFTGEAVSPRRGLTPDRVIANAKLRARLGWQPRYPSFREGFVNFLSR
jgi:nucleoside-diphosphate-sugar epimerase